MNNVIKRVSAFVMAFTLLGTGTVVTKNILPESDTTIVADAAVHPEYSNGYTPDDQEFWYGAPVGYENFYIGSYGTKVAWIQKAIKYLVGYPMPIDGSYGNQTYQAVSYFQKLVNTLMKKRGYYPFQPLTVDGVYGPNTHFAMKEMLKNGDKFGIQHCGW